MKLSLTTCSIAAAAALAILPLPSAASANSLPTYAANDGETIHGRISSVTGKYDLDVRDDRGYVDHVVLHDGTVINPTGLTLATGDVVTISGRNEGRVFRADEIDTPYSDDMQSSNDDTGGFGYQGYPIGYPDGYDNPYAYGYFSGYAGGYFGGGYDGGGYSGRYFGHSLYSGRSYNHGSYGRGGNVGRSNGPGATSSHGGSTRGFGGGPMHH